MCFNQLKDELSLVANRGAPTQESQPEDSREIRRKLAAVAVSDSIHFASVVSIADVYVGLDRPARRCASFAGESGETRIVDVGPASIWCCDRQIYCSSRPRRRNLSRQDLSALESPSRILPKIPVRGPVISRGPVALSMG